MTEVVAVVPARAGSKGLTSKNTRDLGGKPLVRWTIEAAISSNRIHRVIVTTDDPKVIAACSGLDIELISRPEELANDRAGMSEVVTHALRCVGISNGTGVLLQPTSPFRTKSHISEALDCYRDESAEALIAVKKIDNEVLKSFFIRSNRLVPIANKVYPFMRRQDLPEIYKPNGSIYIFDIESYLRTESFFAERTIGFQMDIPSSLDVDTLADLRRARALINEKS